MKAGRRGLGGDESAFCGSFPVRFAAFGEVEGVDGPADEVGPAVPGLPVLFIQHRDFLGRQPKDDPQTPEWLTTASFLIHYHNRNPPTFNRPFVSDVYRTSEFKSGLSG